MESIGGRWLIDKMNNPVVQVEKNKNKDAVVNDNLFKHQTLLHNDQRRQMFLKYLEWVDPEEKIEGNENIHPLSLQRLNEVKKLNKNRKGRKISACHWMAHSEMKRADYGFDSTFTGDIPKEKKIIFILWLLYMRMIISRR